MSKMRCRRCMWFNYDFFDRVYDTSIPPFCGLHGRSRVNPDGEQQNLDLRGSCGFAEKNRCEQLELFEEEEQ